MIKSYLFVLLVVGVFIYQLFLKILNCTVLYWDYENQVDNKFPLISVSSEENVFMPYECQTESFIFRSSYRQSKLCPGIGMSWCPWYCTLINMLVCHDAPGTIH